jgi:hypothetical protein
MLLARYRNTTQPRTALQQPGTKLLPLISLIVCRSTRTAPCHGRPSHHHASCGRSYVWSHDPSLRSGRKPLRLFLQRKQSLHAATATTSVNAPTIAKKQISLSTNYYARVSKTLLLPLLQIMFAPSSFRKSSHDRTLHGCGSRINQLTDWRTLLSLASIYTP